jgi:predicted Zn-dependent protease
MGETVSVGMPLGSERRLGDQIWAEVRRDTSYLDDPVLWSYLQALWWPLVQAAKRKGDIGEDMASQFAWQAFLIRDRSINAFALPGGYVGMHLGLIAATHHRDELVSVVAHELAHVTQRHIARSIESSGRQSAIGMAAMLLGLIAASRSGNVDAAQAAVATGQAAMIQGQLNFSRDMEREADRLGQVLMTDAGFLASGMPSMFEKLDMASRLNDAGQFPYLRSHPLTADRISEAQLRAGLGAERGFRADPEHDVMRARARVLMDPGIAALQQHVQLLQAAAASAAPGPRVVPVAAVYAAALAAVQLKDAGALQQAFVRWLPQASEATDPALQRWMRLLWVEAELALPGSLSVLPGAARWLEPLGVPSTWQRAELAIWGRQALQQASPASASPTAPFSLADVQQALRGWLIANPGDGTLWELLSQTEAARGNRLGMMRATAEAQLAAGRPDTAMVTLQAARQGARNQPDADPVELAVIDTRLAELRKARRELQAERGGRVGDRRDDRDPERFANRSTSVGVEQANRRR